jgi:hypothetical protein
VWPFGTIDVKNVVATVTVFVAAASVCGQAASTKVADGAVGGVGVALGDVGVGLGVGSAPEPDCVGARVGTTPGELGTPPSPPPHAAVERVSKTMPAIAKRLNDIQPLRAPLPEKTERRPDKSDRRPACRC